MKKLSGGLALLLLFASTCFAQTVPPPRPQVSSSKKYGLSFTSSADLSGGKVLEGATLSGVRYVFTSLASSAAAFDICSISRVCFWLDDVFMACGQRSSKAGTSNDYCPPFLFRSAQNAGFDTTKISHGTHRIVQKVTTAGGLGDLKHDRGQPHVTVVIPSP